MLPIGQSIQYLSSGVLKRLSDRASTRTPIMAYYFCSFMSLKVCDSQTIDPQFSVEYCQLHASFYPSLRACLPELLHAVVAVRGRLLLLHLDLQLLRDRDLPAVPFHLDQPPVREVGVALLQTDDVLLIAMGMGKAVAEVFHGAGVQQEVGVNTGSGATRAVRAKRIYRPRVPRRVESPRVSSHRLV